MSCSLCLHQAHSSALTVNLHPFLCFYLALCVTFLLSGSSLTLFSLTPCPTWPLLSGSSPSPLLLSLLLPGPFLSGSCSNLFFWSKVRNAEEWRKSEGKEDEGSRVVGCNGVCLCLSLPLPPSQCIFDPYSCTYIINVSNKTHFLSILHDFHMTFVWLFLKKHHTITWILPDWYTTDPLRCGSE